MVLCGYIGSIFSGNTALAATLFTNKNSELSRFDSGHDWNFGHNGENSSDDTPFELPDLGSGGERFDERQQHKLLAEWSIRQINNNAPLLNDPWSQYQLEHMAWTINAQARTQAPLALIVLSSPSINAFAIPGGVMGINAGTVTSSNSIDEVASVVAHEVAHISQRHYAHKDESNKKALLMQVGGVLAAIAAASASADSNATTAILMGSQTAALNSQMAYSRSNEREADRIGMQLMSKAGYDPTAMPRFFSTLNSYSQLNSNPSGYLPSFIMSHPLSSERLSEAQSRANTYRARNPALITGSTTGHSADTEVFSLLKWRIKMLTQQTNEVELSTAATKSVGASLALALWYAKEGYYDKANKQFSELHDVIEPSSEASILLAITEAQAAGLQNHWQQAKGILQPIQQSYPERRDLRLHLADIYLHLAGGYTQAQQLLQPLIAQRPFDIEALSDMQRSYEFMALDSNNASHPFKPCSVSLCSVES